jgi:hypothetical protein
LLALAIVARCIHRPLRTTPLFLIVTGLFAKIPTAWHGFAAPIKAVSDPLSIYQFAISDHERKNMRIKSNFNPILTI